MALKPKVHVFHEMPKSHDENALVHATILNFDKTFDKVPHQRLLRKLESSGIQGSLYMPGIIFTGRSQTDVCEGKAAKSTLVRSGSPKGQSWGLHYF